MSTSTTKDKITVAAAGNVLVMGMTGSLGLKILCWKSILRRWVHTFCDYSAWAFRLLKSPTSHATSASSMLEFIAVCLMNVQIVPTQATPTSCSGSRHR